MSRKKRRSRAKVRNLDADSAKLEAETRMLLAEACKLEEETIFLQKTNAAEVRKLSAEIHLLETDILRGQYDVGIKMLKLSVALYAVFVVLRQIAGGLGWL